jgi:hypothetical protein
LRTLPAPMSRTSERKDCGSTIGSSGFLWIETDDSGLVYCEEGGTENSPASTQGSFRVVQTL